MDQPLASPDLPPGSTVVVKVGGGNDIDHESLYEDVRALQVQGIRVVLVHGGNALMTEMQARLDTPARFVENARGHVSRYTDQDAMRVMCMTYAGVLNVQHVCALRARGVNALGLTGVDGGLITGRRQSAIRCIENGKKKVLRDDHAGTIEAVNVPLLTTLLDQGYTPVVTVPAYAESPEAHAGVPINVDGDTAAARIAEGLHADALLLLSDVPGLLADVGDPESRFDVIETELDWQTATDAGQGRMRRKIEAARATVDAGVGSVVIASANQARPIQDALRGSGTTFRTPRVDEVIA